MNRQIIQNVLQYFDKDNCRLTTSSSFSIAKVGVKVYVFDKAIHLDRILGELDKAIRLDRR